MNSETFTEEVLITIKRLKLPFWTSAGLVAQWITRLTTDQKIPGSNPGKLVLLLGRFADLFAVSSTHAHSVIKK